MYNSILLTPGCFDRGGISRYTFFQIQALRKLFTYVKVFSLIGPEYKSCDQILEDVVVTCRSYPTLFTKVILILRFLVTCFRLRPSHIFLCHINFVLLLPFLRLMLPNSKLFVNLYGHELWSSSWLKSRFFINYAHALIFDCFNTKQRFLSINDSFTGQLFVVWDCVDVDLFRPCSEPPIYDFPYIVTLGRLTQTAKHKGYLQLIDNFYQLLPDYPYLKLVICGDGDYRPILERHVSSLSITNSVIFSGYVSDTNLSNIFSHGQLFSLISYVGLNAGEGIPLTPLEALSCGLPIVVGNQDGSRECIQSNVGFSVDPLDNSAILQHYRYLLNLDDRERKLLSHHCRTTALSYFSQECFENSFRSLLVSDL